jgi:hypothetical protein
MSMKINTLSSIATQEEPSVDEEIDAEDLSLRTHRFVIPKGKGIRSSFYFVCCENPVTGAVT